MGLSFDQDYQNSAGGRRGVALSDNNDCMSDRGESDNTDCVECADCPVMWKEYRQCS